MRIRILGLMLVLTVSCEQKTQLNTQEVNELGPILSAFFEYRISEHRSFSKDQSGAVSNRSKIMIDSMTPIIDSSLVRNVASPYIGDWLANGVISSNSVYSRINRPFFGDTSRYTLTDSNGIHNLYKRLISNKVDLKNDTQYIGAIRIFNPEISLRENQAIVPFDQNGILHFSILEKDTSWTVKREIATAIE